MKRHQSEAVAIDTAECLESQAREIYANADGLKAVVWEALHVRTAVLLADIKRAVKAEGGAK